MDTGLPVPLHLIRQTRSYTFAPQDAKQVPCPSSCMSLNFPHPHQIQPDQARSDRIAHLCAARCEAVALLVLLHEPESPHPHQIKPDQARSDRITHLCAARCEAVALLVLLHEPEGSRHMVVLHGAAVIVQHLEKRAVARIWPLSNSGEKEKSQRDQEKVSVHVCVSVCVREEDRGRHTGRSASALTARVSEVRMRKSLFRPLWP